MGLLDCAPADGAQEFIYAAATGAFHPVGNAALCLAVAPTSKTAGPFMSRELSLAACSDTDASLRHWLLKGSAPAK